MLAVRQISAVEVPLEEVARLRAVIGKLARHLRSSAGAGLTPTQRSVLFELVHAGEPVRIGDLAAREGLNPTLLSRVIGHLVEEGLVVRAADASDRRAATVAATPKGRRLRDRARSERNDVLARLLAEASPEEREALLAALPALEALAEAVKEQRS
jgi:DNA-binding MarR family transcriptional regulator